ncbi:MAG: cadmium-translocating P-type ATPase [Ruminococcus sp.]|nr:cadmium-translocating P-type ATPase [Ruminococcus sp.]
MAKELKGKYIEVGLGAILYVYALFICELRGVSGTTEAVVYTAAWLVLSAGVFVEMIRNFKNMQFLDENLLILMATLGAVLIEKYPEAVGAVLLYQIGKMIETIAVNNAKKSIARHIDIRPDFANLKLGSQEQIIDPKELKEGQIIIIKPGEKIPVDAVVTEGIGMVDMKALTGESVPREVKVGKKIYSGSINLNSVLEARVSRVYAESTASRVMDLVEEASNKKSKSENFADKFRKYYTPIVTVLGIMVMMLPPIFVEGHSAEEWLYRGLVFLVSACPLGLLVSVPLAFLGGIGAASRQGVLIKGSDYLEALSEVETIVFDKTGTLTEGTFIVKEICPKEMRVKELLEMTALAEAHSSHPIAVSLRKAYGKKPDLTRVKDVKEHSGFGVSAIVDGKEVYIGNARFMNSLGYFYPSVDSIGTVVYAAIDGEYAGYILIGDKIRDGMKRTIAWLHRNDIETVMFTGDNKKVAYATAQELGMKNVFAGLMPEDKVEHLEEFMGSQREDEKLVVIGDGINDAPVLARADIGIAMGGLGADAALEAADVILMRDNPTRIVNAIRISKATVKAVKQNVIFAIAMKVILLVLALFGYLTMRNAIIADTCVMLINILNSFWVLKYPE